MERGECQEVENTGGCEKVCEMAVHCLIKTQFHNGDHMVCMLIVMASRDCPDDVMARPAIVSKLHLSDSLRGLVCTCL